MVRNGCSHPVGVHLSVVFHAGHVSPWHTLLLCHRTVFVCQQERFQVHNLFPQSSDLLGELIVLCLIEVDLILEVSQPLLLPLATLQGSHAVDR